MLQLQTDNFTECLKWTIAGSLKATEHIARAKTELHLLQLPAISTLENARSTISSICHLSDPSFLTRWPILHILALARHKIRPASLRPKLLPVDVVLIVEYEWLILDGVGDIAGVLQPLKVTANLTENGGACVEGVDGFVRIIGMEEFRDANMIVWLIFGLFLRVIDQDCIVMVPMSPWIEAGERVLVLDVGAVPDARELFVHLYSGVVLLRCEVEVASVPDRHKLGLLLWCQELVDHALDVRGHRARPDHDIVFVEEILEKRPDVLAELYDGPPANYEAAIQVENDQERVCGTLIA